MLPTARPRLAVNRRAHLPAVLDSFTCLIWLSLRPVTPLHSASLMISATQRLCFTTLVAFNPPFL